MIESNTVKLFKCPICNKIYKLVDKNYTGSLPLENHTDLKYGFYSTDFGDKLFHREYSTETIPLEGNTLKIDFGKKIKEIIPLCCNQFVEDNSINCEDWVAEKVFTVKGEPF